MDEALMSLCASLSLPLSLSLSLLVLGLECPAVVIPDRASCLPTLSHLLIVNKTPPPPSPLSLCLPSPPLSAVKTGIEARENLSVLLRLSNETFVE